MTIFMTLGGLVFGLLMFMFIKREWKREENQSQMRGKSCPCPGCGIELIPAAWRAGTERGQFFRCVKCRSRSIWNLEGKTSILVESHIRGKR